MVNKTVTKKTDTTTQKKATPAAPAAAAPAPATAAKKPAAPKKDAAKKEVAAPAPAKKNVAKKDATKAASKTSVKSSQKATGGAAGKKKATGGTKAVKKSTGVARVAAAGNANIARPTRNRTAYMMFVKDVRTKVQNSNVGMSFVDVTREVANQWGALSGREKKNYADSAAKDKERYVREVATFRESYPDEPLTIKKKKRVAKLKGPKKARSAYVFYTIEQRPSLKTKYPDLSFGELTQRVAEGWNALTDVQKQTYEQQAAADRTRFEGENKAFNDEHPEVARRRRKARKNAPKKARSAYLYYTQDIRPNVASTNPAISFGELTKLVAAQWAKLSDAQKKKYQKMADDDRKRYESEIANYTPPSDEELDADENKRKRKDPNAPTHPRTAYVYYTMENRAKTQTEHPEMKFGEITKLLAAEWNALAENVKSKYVEQSDADKIRYQNELAAASN